jgi:hypothetical protein
MFRTLCADAFRADWKTNDIWELCQPAGLTRHLESIPQENVAMANFRDAATTS